MAQLTRPGDNSQREIHWRTQNRLQDAHGRREALKSEMLRDLCPTRSCAACFIELVEEEDDFVDWREKAVIDVDEDGRILGIVCRRCLRIVRMARLASAIGLSKLQLEPSALNYLATATPSTWRWINHHLYKHKDKSK